MCLQPWSCTSAAYKWSYGAFQCFSYAWHAIGRAFLRYRPITNFGRIWKIISSLNLANFSTSARMEEVNFPDVNSFGFAVPLWCYWHLLGWAPKTQTLEVYALRRCHCFTVIFSFTCHRKFRHLLALGPNTFGISIMFHDSILSNPSRSWRSFAYNWRLYVIGISKHEVVLMWPWAAHLPIMVELNQQMYCGQQKVAVKYHLDRSSVGRMTARKPVFDLQYRTAMHNVARLSTNSLAVRDGAVI